MFDLMTTAAVADELSSRIVGGRVQTAGLADRETMVLEIYAQHARQRFVATIGGREPACFLSEADVRPDPDIVTPFSLLLRKHVRGAMVAAVSQPPLERIVRLSLAKLVRAEEEALDDQHDDGSAGDLVHTTLVVEIMGHRSNVILIDDDEVILASLKRVTAQMSPTRPVLPQRQYEPPPSGDRMDPRSVKGSQLQAAIDFRRENEHLDPWLVRRLAGISPQMAQEICFLATGTSNCTGGDGELNAIARATRTMMRSLEESKWSPTLYVDGEGTVRAYAARTLSSLDAEPGVRVEPQPTISTAIETFRGAPQLSVRHSGRRDRLLKHMSAAMTRAKAKLHALEHELEAAENGDRFRRWGEAIFANLWSIEPGQAILEWEGEHIPIDPGKPPAVVAQDYFARYRKAGRGRDQLQPLVNHATTELAYIEQVRVLASFAESFEDIETLRKEWESHAATAESSSAHVSKRRPLRKTAAPRPYLDHAGNKIYAGKSGLSNDTVTFDIAGPQDFWFHARGVPGAHVILRPANSGPNVADEAFERAASLAAFLSALRQSGLVEVDICRRADVRKIKGAGPGMVTYRNERTVRVAPASPESLGLTKS